MVHFWASRALFFIQVLVYRFILHPCPMFICLRHGDSVSVFKTFEDSRVVLYHMTPPNTRVEWTEFTWLEITYVWVIFDSDPFPLPSPSYETEGYWVNSPSKKVNLFLQNAEELDEKLSLHQKPQEIIAQFFKKKVRKSQHNSSSTWVWHSLCRPQST
jgi:hypothetical protein